jgi:hypothetical protein
MVSVSLVDGVGGVGQAMGLGSAACAWSTLVVTSAIPPLAPLASCDTSGS